jgi:hypothetical protein
MPSVAYGHVARWRRVSLLLVDEGLANSTEIFRWFGAVQTRDLSSGLCSLGVGLPGWYQDEVLAAFADGSVLDPPGRSG